QPHSGRTLFAHLAGTYSLLQAWGNPMHVCLGGLFHSIYGTNAFRHRSLPEDQRFALQSLIGIQAERLAWDFCHISRPREILSALSSRVDNCKSEGPDWIALAEIEAANLIEQADTGNSLR